MSEIAIRSLNEEENDRGSWAFVDFDKKICFGSLDTNVRVRLQMLLDIFERDYSVEDYIETKTLSETLEHEILHLILWNVIGVRVSERMDNISASDIMV